MHNLFLTLFTICCITQLSCSKKDHNRHWLMSDTELEAAFSDAKEKKFIIDFNKKLSPTLLQTDLKLFKLMLEEAQTSIYRYSTKEEVDAAFEKAFDAAQDSLYYLEFLRLVTGVQNTIACGHSGWGHSKAFKQFRNERMRFLPISISITDTRYFIDQVYDKNKDLVAGTELLNINGMSMEEITLRLKAHMHKDGESGLSSMRGIEQYLSMAYANFIDNPDSFTLKLSLHDSIYSTRVEAQSLAVINATKTPKEGLGIPLRLAIDDASSTAVYTIKWFRNEYIAQMGQDFVAFTDSVFEEVAEQKIDTLIIDLRGNVGGWTGNGRHLFSYFINNPTPYIKRVEVKKPRGYSFEPLILHHPGWLDTFELQKNKRGLFEWTNYPSLIAEPVAANRFSGTCYVLIDHMSQSCSSVFSALMQDHTDAIFVGEETGAAKCGANGMVMTTVLPYTGIIINLSTAMYTFNVNDTANAKGIVPDVEMEEWKHRGGL